ncbi:antibiotic biosynthesis monooxygenase family protein [Halobaculum sp. EA56]|uniref:antibiotic biosynthesis monooxygenase family protein n=1 Tax=Halobaculum sp. EA56 TaxID=3421648 RepID=UPI003EB946CD
MIIRIWHGRTTPENAEEYERLAAEENFEAIAERAGDGYRGFDLARRELDDGTYEYVSVTRFDSWEAVEAFGGDDPEAAYVPPEARELLTEYDERVQHYEVREAERV